MDINLLRNLDKTKADLQKLVDNFPFFPDDLNFDNVGVHGVKDEKDEEINQLKKQLAETQGKLRRVHAQSVNLNASNIDLLLRLKGLRHRLIKGEDPNHDAVKMYKKDLKFTKKMHNCQKMLIPDKSNKEFTQSDIQINETSDWVKFQNDKLTASIVDYLNKN